MMSIYYYSTVIVCIHRTLQFHHYIYKQCHDSFRYVLIYVYLPFVTMLTILNIKLTRLLIAPGFLTHTDTVPELYWGSPLMGTEGTGCLTDVAFI